MARIGPREPRPPPWPWGGPRSIRERLVDPAQFERKRLRKKADPRNPPLASMALLDFMGPGHSSDEVRLPPPPDPYAGAESDIEPFPDRGFTRSVVERGQEQAKEVLTSAFAKVQVAPDRLDRMKAVLNREAQMLSLLGKVQAETDEVIERMKAEYKANGQY